jgi:hypothetical protein
LSTANKKTGANGSTYVEALTLTIGATSAKADEMIVLHVERI